jgi:hypothetical protein
MRVVRTATRPARDASCRAVPTNYSGDAGAGSHSITNISESPAWRAALLGTVAAGSLWLYSARTARAACVNSGGSTYSCSGANTTQQTINANNAAVSTVPGFSVITTDPRAVSIAGAMAPSPSSMSIIRPLQRRTLPFSSGPVATFLPAIRAA